VFVVTAFGRWARREDIDDVTLLNVIDDAAKGIIFLGRFGGIGR